MTPDKIQTKYNEAFSFLQQRKRRQAEQLKLLSNLRRGEQNISSTLLLTLFDRIMSSTYDDKIQVKFIPSQGITQDQINSYNILAQSDYQEMGKAKLDYDLAWDTLFFGRGYIETGRFDKKRKIMQPHVINPLVFGYDPYIENPQDWRYYWKWITKSKADLTLLQSVGMLKKVKLDSLSAGIDPYLWQYKVTRDQAREGVAPPIDPVDSDVYQILEYYGYNDVGKKCVYWVDKLFSTILYESELDLGDGDEIVTPNGKSVRKNSNWPIVVKESFRVPHSSLPISVADLLEDKHRAKAVLLNLAYIAAKDQANPLYWYDPAKVQDVSQFLSRQVNQHIPVEGDGALAVGPLNKAHAMTADLISFIQMMDAEAENPIGAGKPMDNATGGSDKTATQAALNQQLNDMAQSLQSKVMQFGESEFWSHWFHRYARHADELKEKMANIVGVKGVDTRIIDLKDFKTDYPPGVMVFSAKEAEYKNLVKRRDMMQMFPALAQTLEPDGMRNFQKHVFWPLMLEDPSLIDVMFPKTLDEMKAEGENEQLKENLMPDVLETDDHTTHIYIHMMVQPKTWATWFHLDWHQKLLAEQRKQEMVMQQNAINDSMGAIEPGKPKVSAEKKSPLAQASPLKTETQSDIKSNLK